METIKLDSRILKILFKDFSVKHTITSIAKEVEITRVGVWKVLKKLEIKKLVTLSPIGAGITSTYNVNLNWDNPLVEKFLSLILTEEAIKNQRWINNFTELENKVNFLIIYGSIIHSPKEANDIDVLGITNKNNFVEIEESIKKIQKTQIKKIHSLNLTEIEFKKELEKSNKAFIDAIKKGIVLFGQEKFIKFIRGIRK
ncbi:MAG: hypothetical protein PHF86_09070 [Candidatus Nanoarchaeia archaeon]|nr:hypothetical protein [Candidatus Nanoarchaeia archaeon]